MSATTSGAFKALIESAGLGIAVYRDQAPPNAPLPFVVIHEGIGMEPIGGDFADPDQPVVVRELVQVDVYQAKKNPASGRVLEDYTLTGSLMTLLRGSLLPNPPTRSWPLKLRDARRLPVSEPIAGVTSSNIIRTTATVEFLREA